MNPRVHIEENNPNWPYNNIWHNAKFYISGIERKALEVQSVSPNILRIYCNDGSAYVYDDSTGRAIYSPDLLKTLRDIDNNETIFSKWFARNLKWILQGHCYNQEMLARDLGVAQGTISNWVNGKTYPNAYHVSKMARLFNIPITDFYDFI